MRLNNIGRIMIANGVLVSFILYFLSTWAKSKNIIWRVISKIRNYLFAGTSQPARARVVWQVVCLSRRDNGFNIVNSLEVVISLIAK